MQAATARVSTDLALPLPMRQRMELDWCITARAPMQAKGQKTQVAWYLVVLVFAPEVRGVEDPKRLAQHTNSASY